MSLIFKKSSAQPEFTVGATIVGSPLVNSLLTCNYRVDRARPQNVAIEWRGTVLAGQGEDVLGTSINYIPSAADEGRQIRVVVTAINPAGAVQSASAYTSAIVNTDTPADDITAGPTVSLDDFATTAPALIFAQGEYVKCEVTVSSGTPTFQWFYDDDGTGTNKTNLTGVTATQPLPYSQPNNWKSACFISTSVPVGKRVGCDVTLGATTVRAYMAGNLAAIEGTPISHSTGGTLTVGAAPAAPYRISNAGRYYLTEDIEFAGSGFIINRNITLLNLNGYTITYNARTMPTVTNGDFEDDWTGWDNTNAPNAVIHAPADAAAAYRNNQLWTGSKSLAFDATQNEYIQSTSTVTLTGGVTYALTAHMSWGPYNSSPGVPVTGRVQFIANDGTTVAASGFAGRATTDNWNNRGMKQAVAEFKPATTGNYYIRVGCTGDATASAYPFYVDRIHLGQSRVSGIVMNTTTRADQADIASPQAATQIWQIRVRNGTIEEQNTSISPFDETTKRRNGVIYGNGNIRGNVFSRLHLIARGDNCHCGVLFDSSTAEFSNTLVNCTLENNTLVSVNRDNYYGSVTYEWAGTIAFNTITTSAHGGFVAGGLMPYNIYGNTITMQARYANAFCIRGNPSGKVYDNTILCGTGGNGARGIAIVPGTLASPAEVYNNWVEVQEPGLLQEYNGGWSWGNYGLQLEVPVGSSTVNDVKVHDNVVIANSSALYPSQALRLTMAEGVNGTGVRTEFYDNDFRAYSSGSRRSSCISVSGGSLITFTGNTLRTNDCLWFATDAISNYVLDDTLIYADSLVGTPNPFRVNFYANNSAVEFTNTRFQDAGSETFYENAQVYGEFGQFPATETLTVTKTS